FAPGEAVELRFGSEDAVSVEADGDGNVTGEITVAEDAMDGVYPITALGAVSNIEAVVTLQVRAPLPGAEATSVQPTADADDVVVGDLVAMTAVIEPSAAVGSVEFVEGETVVGTASVSGGSATADIEIATSGEHTFVARFIPADPEAFLASQSEPLTIEVRSAPVLEAEIELSTDTVMQGGSFELIGRGFAGGEQVTIDLHSDPIQLATVTADGSGSFRIQVTVPVTVQPGDHTVVVTGDDSGLSAEAALAVTAAAGGGEGGLPGTGALVPVGLIVLVLGLLLAGGVLVMRRREQIG